MRVFVYSSRTYDQPELERFAGSKHDLLFSKNRLTIDTVHYASECIAISIFTADDASAPVLERLHANGVRFIALRSVGYDHVDIATAESLGIKVANVPEYSPHSVAEHAVALLMTMNRKILEGQCLMHLQDYRIDTLKGFDIYGKTVGVIGTGKIGMAFARIMTGFGASVLACDPVQNPAAEAVDMRYVSLEQLLRESDIISIHCPLTPETRHLISNREFTWMKKGAILINTARGPIIDTEELIHALDGGRLRAACLDVYEHEKGLFFNDHRDSIIHDEKFIRLQSFRNVLITCHQAFLTQEAIEAIASTTASNLDSWERNNSCVNEISKAGITSKYQTPSTNAKH